jgi:LysM repeat protein
MIKLLFILSLSLFNPESRMDSVGLETVNGKTFIIHRVDEKETLFGISRRYGTTVDAIKSSNTIAAGGLEIGQMLKIPYTPKPALPKDAVIHTVAQKETLYSIARQYGVTMDDIKKWNGLTDNALALGQQIRIRKPVAGTSPAANTSVRAAQGGVHVVAEKETLYSIARAYQVSVADIQKWNNLQPGELKIGQQLIVSASADKTAVTPVTRTAETTPVTQTQKETPIVSTQKMPPATTRPAEQTIRISESTQNGDEVLETGVAELIDGTEGNRKYLALHRTAPVGTILKVRNEMNNREVFVRVMGKLPDTAMTDKVIIRISKSAYDRLGAIDQRFRVEVTYYK